MASFSDMGQPPQQQQQPLQSTLKQESQLQLQPQQQTVFSFQPIYSAMPFMNQLAPVHPVQFGSALHPNFYMSTQSSCVVGAGMPAQVSAAVPNTKFPAENPTSTSTAVSSPCQTFTSSPFVGTSGGQQQQQEVSMQQPTTVQQLGTQTFSVQRDPTSISSCFMGEPGGRGRGQDGPPPQPPNDRGTFPPFEHTSASAGTQENTAPVPSASKKLLETILHVDKPLADLGRLQPHRTLINADPHWHCMLEESQTYISYRPLSSLANDDVQEETIRVPIRRLSLRLQFCPDPHMAEFRKHALQFTTLQVIGYGSQQVELTQRISGQDLVNKGIKVYIDPRQILYNHKSSYGFSIVLTNQPIAQLASIPRTPINTSSTSTDVDPSFGDSLEVPMTSAYCRRNLAEMYKDATTADTIIYVLDPRLCVDLPTTSNVSDARSPTTATGAGMSMPPLRNPFVVSQQNPSRPQRQYSHGLMPITTQRQPYQQFPETTRPISHPASSSQQHSAQRHEEPHSHTAMENESNIHDRSGYVPAPGATRGQQSPRPLASATNDPSTDISVPRPSVVNAQQQALAREHFLQDDEIDNENERVRNAAASPDPLARPLDPPQSPQHERPTAPATTETEWQQYRQQRHQQQRHWQGYQQFQHLQSTRTQQNSQSLPHQPAGGVQQQAHHLQSLLPHPTSQAPQHGMPPPHPPPSPSSHGTFGSRPSPAQTGHIEEPIPQQEQHQQEAPEPEQKDATSLELKAHHIVIKSYPIFSRMLRPAAQTGTRQRLHYYMFIHLENPYLMYVLLEYMYTHQVIAPAPITSQDSTTSSAPDSTASSSCSTFSASTHPQQCKYTYTWRELYEVADRFKLTALTNIVKCALIAELTPQTVQTQLLEWVYLYQSLYPAYLKYAIDNRIDLLGAVHDMHMELDADEEQGHLLPTGNSRTGSVHSTSIIGTDSSERWRRQRLRQAAEAEAYFRHTSTATTIPSTGDGADTTARRDGGLTSIATSMVWSQPKYAHVVSRYTSYLNGQCMIPTGFVSKS